MKHADFYDLVTEFERKEHGLLDLKAGDYATEGDRLANFHQVGLFLGVSPAWVAMTYLMKHIQAIANAVAEPDALAGKWSWVTPLGQEGLKQRIADARNYLLLLAACIEDGERVG